MNCAADLGSHAAEIFIGNANHRAAHIAGKTLRLKIDRLRNRRRIQIVAAADKAKHRGRVVNRAGETPYLVKRRCERNKPVTGHPSIRWLYADDAAEGRGLAYRAAGIRTEGSGGHHRGNRSGRPARAPAGYAPGIVRIFYRPEKRRFRRSPHRKFIHIGLSKRHNPALKQLPVRRRIIGRNKISQHARTARCKNILRAYIILDGDRNSVPRRKAAALATTMVGFFRLRNRDFIGNGDIRVKSPVSVLRVIDIFARYLDRRDFPSVEKLR